MRDDLLKIQLRMQRDAARALEEKIEEAIEKKSGQKKDLRRENQAQYSIAKAILKPYFLPLQEKIEETIFDNIHKVVRRLIRENEAAMRDFFHVDYKNLDDPLGNPLTKGVIQNHRGFMNKRMKKRFTSQIVQDLKEEKKDFSEMDDAQLLQYYEEALRFVDEYLGPEGRCLKKLNDEKNTGACFKNDPEKIALALAPLSTQSIASAVVTTLLSLLYKSRLSDDAKEDIRPEVGEEIGKSIYMRVGVKKYIQSREKKREENLGELRKFLNEWGEKRVWEDALIHKVGQEMIDVALEIGMIDTTPVKEDDTKTLSKVHLTEKFLKTVIHADRKALTNFSLTFKPMVVQPRPWTDMFDGGFLKDDNSDPRFSFPLMKANSSKDREALKDITMPEAVLNAVNALQNVPFCINEKIFEIVEKIYGKLKYIKSKNRVDYDYYKILRQILVENLDALELPEIYRQIAKSNKEFGRKNDLTKRAQEHVKIALSEIADHPDRDTLKLDAELYYQIAKYKNGFDVMFNIAKEMREYERFYFVWTMDFRGRLYPKQTLLHPQGGDLPKSFLLFAEKKPLGEEGLKWLKIHGANVYGEADKTPFEERSAWVDTHEAEILASAENFEKENFWKKADDPFRFLAFCFEYARYLKDPESFVTGLPIAIDGSNNGFQHVSTLLHDEDGARRVNVLPKTENGKTVVGDIYQDVAETLKTMLKEEYENLMAEVQNGGYIEKNGLYYKIETKTVVRFESIVPILLDKLETVELPKNPQNYLLKIIAKKQEKKIKERSGLQKRQYENWIDEIEKKVREGIDEDFANDLEEIKEELKSELNKIYRRAKKMVKKGEWREEFGKIISMEEKESLLVASLFGQLLKSEALDRSFVKKPVMTESYGSTEEGKKYGYLETLEKKGLLKNQDEYVREKLAEELAKLTEDAIEKITPSAGKYNEWMKHVIEPLKSKNATPIWTTPLGLTIKQVEFKTKKYMLSVAKDDKVTIRIYTDQIDYKEHEKGLPPNYIHSLDATHLMMTINRLVTEGITDFYTVHDSYASHAADIECLSKILRSTFVKLHRESPLERFKEEMEERFEIELENIPYISETFDFDEILKSIYMFA